MSDLTGELLAAVVAAPDARKREALKVLRGELPPADAETLRRCSGQAEPYLTLREVGRRLGVSPCSLWRWGVPGHELGGRRRFRMSEVEAYLAGEEFKQRASNLKEDRRDASLLRTEATASGPASPEAGYAAATRLVPDRKEVKAGIGQRA